MSGVDVVVVAYRSGDHLRQAVEGLAGLDDVHVVVVDNACPQQSYRGVSDLGVEIVHAGANDGFAAGCNLGIAASSSPSVLLLNPDASLLAASRVRFAALHRGRAATLLERGGIALGAITHLPTELAHPGLVRGQLGALGTSLRAPRSVDVPGS